MHFIGAKYRAAVWLLITALWFAPCALLPVRAFAVTTKSGTPIVHTQANIQGTVSGYLRTGTSNILSPTTVMPVYGLSSYTGEASATMRFSQGGFVDYRFNVKNAGNTTDSLVVEIFDVLYSKEDVLSSPLWTIQVDDQYPFAAGLTWTTSNSASLKASLTTDVASSSTPAGQTKSFTIRVSSVSGAKEGAKVNFKVRVKTASSPKGAYAGFNGLTYGGVAQYSAGTAYAAQALDIQGPVLAFNVTTTGTELTGTAKIYGTAKDTHFSGYSLQYGPGTNPTKWKEITNSTLKVQDSVLAEWDTSSKKGTYTLKLVSTDQFNNSSVSTQVFVVGNELTVAGTLPVGEWTMVSIPGVPYSSLAADLFGNSRYEIQQWDPLIPDASDDKYIRKYQRDFSIDVPGEGFWIKPYGTAITYSFKTSYTESTQVYNLSTKKGWNQVGYPFARSGGMPWSNVQVESSTGTVKTMSAAIAAGWVDKEFWEYSQTGYVMRDITSSVVPYKGYFLQVYENVKLKFDPNYNMAGGLARIVRPLYDWKMQLSASIDGAEDNANYAGQLRGAERTFDQYDSGEPPTVDPYVSLYFENSGWGRRTGRYSSDMKPPLDSGVEQWGFTIETSEPGTRVVLTVPDSLILPDNYIYSIRDDETGKVFDPRVSPEYTYVDSGSGIRRFTLSVTKERNAELVTINHTFPEGWTLFAVPLEPEPTEVKAQLSDDLDNIHVFQYYDGEMYDPNSAEHVDIQSGVGYWLHLESSVVLDFEGVLTSISVPVELDLVEGWNLIGNPYDRDIVFGEEFEVSRGSEKKSILEAADAGWIVPEIYGYNQETGTYEKLLIGSVLEPWRGYAIKAYEQCKLIIKAGS